MNYSLKGALDTTLKRQSITTNTSEEERVLESSDDSHEEDNPTPSIDTSIKSLIASKEQSSAAADAKSGDLLGEIARDLKIKE